MLKESAMEKWFKFEIAKINSGIVTKKRPLGELTEEKTPITEAKDGSIFYYDKKALYCLKNELSKDKHSIMLPISMYFSLDVKDMVYVADKLALSVLKRLGEVPKDAELDNGRYWMSKTLANDMIRRRPTIIQFVRY
ncbi:MAG: DUF61 family protein [Thermoplasmata archaeon]|nr:MAG: DUF61 family protein [Thermoplasmata archaeon]